MNPKLGLAIFVPVRSGSDLYLMEVEDITPTGKAVGTPCNAVRLSYEPADRQEYRIYVVRSTGIYCLVRGTEPLEWFAVINDVDNLFSLHLDPDEAERLKACFHDGRTPLAALGVFWEYLTDDRKATKRPF